MLQWQYMYYYVNTVEPQYNEGPRDCQKLFTIMRFRQGGKRKESMQLRLWNLNICIEKVDANADWWR